MAPAAAAVYVACPDDTVREVLARVVEAGGHTATRGDGDAAAITASGAQAVVLDLGPATQDVLGALRAAGDEQRVVVIGTGPAGARLAWQAGADGYLVRPFDAEQLQAAIDAALTADGAARAAARAAELAALPA